MTGHPSCPVFPELSQAFTEGADEAMQSHLARCPRCKALWRDLEEMKAAASALPWSAPDADRAAELEASLMAATALPAPRRTNLAAWTGGAALAIAAAAAVVLWLGTSETPAPVGEGTVAEVSVPAVEPPAGLATTTVRRATVRAVDGTRFEHRTVHPPDDEEPSREIVRIADGRIALEVDPLGEKERFLVEVGDAEIEVRGTSFEVVAEGDRLQRVTVTEGIVDVRPVGFDSVSLRAGDAWVRPEEAAADAETETAMAERAAPPSPEPAAVAEARAAVPSRDSSGITARADRGMRTPVKSWRSRSTRARRAAGRIARPTPRPQPDPTPDAPPVPSPVPANPRPTPRPQPDPAPTAEPETPRADGTELLPSSETAPPSTPPIPEAAPPQPSPEPERASSPAEQHFASGWEALRAGRPGRAATHFAQAAQADPTHAIAEDARFWHAVALGRADHPDAMRAMATFLSRHSSSPRAAEMSVMLGWRLLDSGRLDEAERRFRRGLSDSAPAVRHEASRGVDAVEEHRRTSGNRVP